MHTCPATKVAPAWVRHGWPLSPEASLMPAIPVQPCASSLISFWPSQVTPVWRAGPYGPKTLCNACGVRYMKQVKKK